MADEAPKGPDDFEPSKYLTSLIAAVNDGAKAAQAGGLAFALVGIYLLATAFSASDEDLLRGRTVTISQIGASLPVTFSFAIAPLVFVFLHIYTLARYDMLAANVRQFLVELDFGKLADADRERCRQLLANVEFIHALVAPHASRLYSPVWRWLVRGVIAVFPVLVLLLVQINALRYQSALITRVQQAALVIDLLALVWFFYRNPLRETQQVRQPLWRWAGMLWIPAIFIPNFIYLGVVPVESDVRLVRAHEVSLADATSNPLDAVLCPWLQWGCRYLRADHRTLVDHVWDEKSIIKLRSGGSEQASALKSLDGLVLKDRSLRFAALDDSSLFKADLRGADLRKASLTSASLQGAWLLRAQLRGADLEEAELRGAELNMADLSGANLEDAELPGASLFGARLQGANLGGAELEGANLEGADLQAALLSWADLRGARLINAKLQMADLQAARLQGADLAGAQLRGAILLGTQLQGANLHGAGLQDIISGTMRLSTPDQQLSTDLSLSDLRDANFTKLPGTEEIKDLRAAIDLVREGEHKAAAPGRLDRIVGPDRPPARLSFEAGTGQVMVTNPSDQVFSGNKASLIASPTPNTQTGSLNYSSAAISHRRIPPLPITLCFAPSVRL
jgi:uncharacterized protein YjbI with pentapeptide repeats